MSQKNTLFHYFGKSPSAKSSPKPENVPSPAGTPKSTASPLSTPKRALSNVKRANGLDSPKTTKPVLQEQVEAASPRTRVQRALMNATVERNNKGHEPHFLRNYFSPKSKTSHRLSTPRKLLNKENTNNSGSPHSVFTALKGEEKKLSSNRKISLENIPQTEETKTPHKTTAEEVIISPRKNLRPVRNLTAEYSNSPNKQFRREEPVQRSKHSDNDENKKTDSLVQLPATWDVYDIFGQYVAAEMRRLDDEKAVCSLKRKVMEAILEVQQEQNPQQE